MRDLSKTEFLRIHQNCCFCGGARSAETLDHQPSRLFFKRREWPEGFVFPACKPCNDISRMAEKALGVLIHGEKEGDDRSKYRSNLRSLAGEFPQEIRSLLPSSTNEKRRIFREMGIELPAGVSFAELPIVKLPVSFWKPHLELIGRKLLLAFHYQCFGKPVPPAGGIQLSIMTNADVMANGFIQEVLDEAKFLVIPKRNNKTLEKQFSVRYNIVDGHDSALFVIKLHDQLIFQGITTDDTTLLEMPSEFLPPLKWDNDR